MSIEATTVERAAETSTFSSSRSRPFRVATRPDTATSVENIQAVIARARLGDRAALGEIYIRYADNVFGHVVGVLRDAHEAEDVTQHVFLKLMSVLDRYERREAPFSAWILRIAHNAAVDNLRQRRAVPVDDPVGDHEHAPTGAAERIRYLRDGLSELPLEQRRVLLMRHLIGMSPPEIALRMGKTESAIHGLHHRGRGKLRETLAGMQEGPSTRAKVAVPV